MTYGAPHHLVADSGLVQVRRTRSGDAWQVRVDGSDGCGAGSANEAAAPVGAVSLGLPSVRRG